MTNKIHPRATSFLLKLCCHHCCFFWLMPTILVFANSIFHFYQSLDLVIQKNESFHQSTQNFEKLFGLTLLIAYQYFSFQVLICPNFCFLSANQREFAQLLALVSCWNWNKPLKRTNMLLELNAKSLLSISTCQKHR